eukprot:3032460-Rhodomonas_salina.1
MRSSFIVGCLSLSFFVTPASPACGVCSFQLPILQLSSNPPTSPPSASVLRMQFQAQCITPLNAPSFRPYPVSRRRLCMLADDARQGEESRKKSKVQKGKTRDDALREIRSQQIQLNKMLSACGSPKEIFETVSLALDTDAGLNAVNLATALHRLSRTSSSSERRALERSPEFNRLLQLAHAEVRSPTPQASVAGARSCEIFRCADEKGPHHLRRARACKRRMEPFAAQPCAGKGRKRICVQPHRAGDRRAAGSRLSRSAGAGAVQPPLSLRRRQRQPQHAAHGGSARARLSSSSQFIAGSSPPDFFTIRPHSAPLLRMAGGARCGNRGGGAGLRGMEAARPFHSCLGPGHARPVQ